MRLLAAFWAVANHLLRRASHEREMEEELRSHLASRTAELERSGLPRAQAERRARIEFGGLEKTREECREAMGAPFLEVLFQDVRLGARRLRRNPGFTVATLFTLALGVGANAAIFTLTYAVILKSLPVPEPQRLVRYTFRNGDMDLGISGPMYDALRKHETSSEDLLAWSDSALALQEKTEVRKVQGALMTANGFQVLRLRPFLGRAFEEADDVSGGGPNGYQALAGFTFWKEHFGGRDDILGRPLNINGRSVTVVGLLPDGFDGLISGQRVDLLLPLAFEEVPHAPNPTRHAEGSFWLTVMGRLKAGESLHSAEANLEATQKAVRDEADPRHIFLAGFFSSFHTSVEGGRSGRSFLKVLYGQPLMALEALVALLLALCCANTALLVLASVSGRTREFAVRRALGAPGERILRQVLSEIGLLSLFGLAGSIALGWAGARILVGMLGAIGEPPPLEARPSLAVLAFTAGVTLISFLAAGIWPALRASRISPLTGMKQAAEFSSPRSVGRWIIPAQVAVSVLLLAVAALLGGSLLRLWIQDSGFRPGSAVMAGIDLEHPRSAGTAKAQYAQHMVESLRNMPGIEAAAAMSVPPISPSWSAGHYYSLGRDGAVHSDMNVWPETVTPGYFAAMGTRILQGRPFEDRDVGADPVCVLSASAARYFFPGVDAVGETIYPGGMDQKMDGKTNLGPHEAIRVIGVAEDVRFRSLREAPPRMLYKLERENEFAEGFHLVARGSSPGAAPGALRDVFRRSMPNAPQPVLFTFDQLVSQNLSKERMLTALSACFAGIALLLTATGLYGLLARNVVLRAREIGLRRALGASPRNTLGLVMGQGFRLVAAGILAGLGVALAATRLLDAFLFGVSATDPLIFAGVALVLVLVALAASSVPAWRAARVDPMSALRWE